IISVLTDRDLVANLVVSAFLDAIDLHNVLGLAVRTIVDDRLGFDWTDCGKRFELLFGSRIDIYLRAIAAPAGGIRARFFFGARARFVASRVHGIGCDGATDAAGRSASW